MRRRADIAQRYKHRALGYHRLAKKPLLTSRTAIAGLLVTAALTGIAFHLLLKSVFS